MSELNYKASNIARAERELNANFFSTLEGLGQGTPSINALLMILRAGGLTEAEADELLDKEGISDAMQKAITALGNAGFLAKLKNEASQVEAQKSQPKASQNTGDETKA